MSSNLRVFVFAQKHSPCCSLAWKCIRLLKSRILITQTNSSLIRYYYELTNHKHFYKTKSWKSIVAKWEWMADHISSVVQNNVLWNLKFAAVYFEVWFLNFPLTSLNPVLEVGQNCSCWSFIITLSIASFIKKSFHLGNLVNHLAEFLLFLCNNLSLCFCRLLKVQKVLLKRLSLFKETSSVQQSFCSWSFIFLKMRVPQRLPLHFHNFLSAEIVIWSFRSVTFTVLFILVLNIHSFQWSFYKQYRCLENKNNKVNTKIFNILIIKILESFWLYLRQKILDSQTNWNIIYCSNYCKLL